MKKNYIFVSIVFFVFVSCTKDRNFTNKPTDPNNPNTGLVVSEGLLKINEIDARGATLSNEFGDMEDWFEIYNTSSERVNITKGKWFVTDDATGDERKFELPDTFIAPNSFLIVFCDDKNTVLTEIHAGFRLSSSGENIGIFYDSAGTNFKVDAYSYPPQNINGRTHGRFPDGSELWTNLNIPTPGQPNEQ